MATVETYRLKLCEAGTLRCGADVIKLSLSTIRRAKAPIVGVPYCPGKPPLAFERTRLKTILECPKITSAQVSVNGDAYLVLSGAGTEYRLKCSVENSVARLGALERNKAWAQGQKKRRRTPEVRKRGRRRLALEKDIARAEKRLGRLWIGRLGRNPILPCVEVWDEEYENKHWAWVRLVGKRGDDLDDWARNAWLRTKRRAGLRQKVGRLGLQTWKNWKALSAACATLGATLTVSRVPDEDSRRRTRAARLSDVTPDRVVSWCGLTPHREEPCDERKYARRKGELDRWLGRRKERRELVAHIEELKGLRDTPDKLAASNVGVPDEVIVEEAE